MALHHCQRGATYAGRGSDLRSARWNALGCDSPPQSALRWAKDLTTLATNSQRAMCRQSQSLHGRDQPAAAACSFQRTACCQARSVHARVQPVVCCFLDSTSQAASFQRTARHQSQSVHGRDQPVACSFQRTACCQARSVHARDQPVVCCFLDSTSQAASFQRTPRHQSQSVHGRDQLVACSFQRTAFCRDQPVVCCFLDSTSQAASFQRTACRQSQSLYGRDQPVACNFQRTACYLDSTSQAASFQRSASHAHDQSSESEASSCESSESEASSCESENDLSRNLAGLTPRKYFAKRSMRLARSSNHSPIDPTMSADSRRPAAFHARSVRPSRNGTTKCTCSKRNTAIKDNEPQWARVLGGWVGGWVEWVGSSGCCSIVGRARLAEIRF